MRVGVIGCGGREGSVRNVLTAAKGVKVRGGGRRVSREDHREVESKSDPPPAAADEKGHPLRAN